MPRKFFLFLLVLPLSLITPELQAENADVKIMFSPADECGGVILKMISSAQKSIELAIYHLTSRSLAKALVMASKNGVSVRVYADGENAREYYSKINFLKKNGVPVKIESGEGLMHNKFCVIDDSTVITGSYNWTTSADLKNDENLLLIDSKEIARTYRLQFEKYWQGDYADKAFYIDRDKLIKHK